MFLDFKRLKKKKKSKRNKSNEMALVLHPGWPDICIESGRIRLKEIDLTMCARLS